MLKVAAFSAAVAGANALHWQSVAIGGGGYVTGIAVSTPSPNGTVYFRTDVGGSYLLQNASWLPLNDKWSYNDKNLYGVSALAISSSDPLKVFAAFGGYLDASPSGIFTSTNGDCNWTQITPANWNVPIGGNDYTHTDRATGERLAVSPGNDDLILFGSELSGLWRTTDGGATWAQVACQYVPCSNTTAAEYGVSLVTFDPDFQRTGTVIACLYYVGMLISSDAGVTWSAMDGSPPLVRRCAWAYQYDGQAEDAGSVTPLWCTADDGVWYMDSSGSWSPVDTPLGNSSLYGIDVNPRNSADILVMCYSWGSPPVKIIRSVDGGKTWTSLLPPVSINSLPWDTTNGTDLTKGNAAANIKFDPRPSSTPGATGRVWLGNWFSMWACDDIDNSLASPQAATTWHNVMPGHEEVFVLSMSAPPVGPLLITGTADLGGFQHPGPSLSSYAPLSYSTLGTDGGEGTGSDYTELVVPAPCNSGKTNDVVQQAAWQHRLGDADTGVPALLVRCQYVPWIGSGSGVITTSCDGGHTWDPHHGWNATYTPLRVAVAAYEPSAMVVLVQQGPAMVTSDGGTTWHEVEGLPWFDYVPLSGNRYNHSSPLTSDRTLQAGNGSPVPSGSSTFYYYDSTEGQLYMSKDSGFSFNPVFPAAGSEFPQPSTRCQLLSMPVTSGQPGAGSLWLAAAEQGLWSGTMTAEGDVQWTQVSPVTNAHNIALGSGPASGVGAGLPVLYLYGTVQGGPSDLTPWASLGPAWGSTASSWVSLASPDQGLGDWTEVMTASRRPDHFGTVVLGSFGRGAFWANASGLLMESARLQAKEPVDLTTLAPRSSQAS